MSEKQVQAQHTQDQGPPETPTLTEDDNKGQMSDDESQWDLVHQSKVTETRLAAGMLLHSVLFVTAVSP